MDFHLSKNFKVTIFKINSNIKDIGIVKTLMKLVLPCGTTIGDTSCILYISNISSNLRKRQFHAK